MSKDKLTIKRAWVVTWEWCGDHAKKNKEIISFFDYRVNERFIKRFVERIYADSEYTLNERLRFLKYPSQNPYKAEYGSIGLVTCGHNPWINAKIVLNLRIENNNLVWDEINRKKIRKELEVSLNKLERKITR